VILICVMRLVCVEICVLGKFIADVETDVWGTHNLDLCNKPHSVSQWQTFNSNLTNYTVPSEIFDIIGGGYVLPLSLFL
jgi:hypothetical protein